MCTTDSVGPGIYGGKVKRDESGNVIKGRGDEPNQHDILTGTQPDGTAFAAGEDKTCGNWTKSGTEGSAIVGE